MAQNPYFSATSNMCLMGDIKAVAYFSWSHSAHLSICIIRIFSYVFFESLDRHYKKIFTFRHFKTHKSKLWNSYDGVYIWSSYQNVNYYMQIIFWFGTISLWLAQYVNQFLVLRKKYCGTCRRTRHKFDYMWSLSECDNYWTCCSSKNPCKEKEGDCDTNADCINDLTCGVHNCGPLFPAHSDCCEKEGKYSNALINMDSNSHILQILGLKLVQKY